MEADTLPFTSVSKSPFEMQFCAACADAAQSAAATSAALPIIVAVLETESFAF